MSDINEAAISRVALQESLQGALESVRGGATRLVAIEGPTGSGRRAAISDLLTSSASDDAKALLPLRVHFTEGEDGLRVMLRLYAALFTGLNAQGELKSAVHAAVDGELEKEDLSEPKKVWFKAFKEGLEKEIPDTEAASFQVTVPRASPYLGMVEILKLVGNHANLLVEVGEAQYCLSFAFWTFLSSLVGQWSRGDSGLFVALWHTEGHGVGTEGNGVSLLRNFLRDLPASSELFSAKLGAMDDAELAAIAAKSYPGINLPEDFLGKLAELSQGMPGHLSQILKRLEDQKHLQVNGDGNWKLDLDAAAMGPEVLVPALPAGDEAKLRRVLQVAALEGRTFTSTVVAQALDLKKDEVDDLIDELDDHVEEVVFHEGLQSWLYRFKSPLFQRHVLTGLSEHALKEQSRILADLLERQYVMRSSEYGAKAARLWGQAGEAARANRLLGLSSSMERPDLLQMGFEIFVSDSESTYSKPITRGLMLTLLERLASGGNLNVGLQVLQRFDAWVGESESPDLAPWVHQYRARFAQRAGRLDEASAQVNEAKAGFAKVKNVVKEAECLSLSASIELGRGQLGKALENAQRAMKQTQFLPVHAQSNFILGMVHKARRDLKASVPELQKALELSARAGMFPLHADAGLNLCEALLMANNAPAALNLLNQLLKFTRQHKMKGRERGVLSLLGKTKAGLQEHTEALQFTSEALKLSREMKNKLAETADLFDMGLFSYLKGALDEAQIYLKEAETASANLQHLPLRGEIQFHLGLVATAQGNLDKAKSAYLEAEKICTEISHEQRLTNILFNLGAIYLKEEQLDAARRYLDKAKPLVEKYGSDQDKKAWRKAQRKLQQKLH